MKRDAITRAWIGLIVLSLITAAISALIDLVPISPVFSVLVLIPALIKAHLILADYLRLRQAKSWLRGGMVAITIVTLTMAVLYLAPMIGQ